MAVKTSDIIVVLLTGCALTLTPAKAQRLKAIRNADGVEISEGDRPVLFYQAKPKSINGKYERADYIHPLYSLRGNVLTEDFPPDHLHQRGIYWAWHQIISKGKQIADGWACDNIGWEVKHTRIRNARGAVTLVNDVLWQSVLQDRLTPVVRERSRITVYGAKDNYRLVDFDIALFPLLDNMALGGSLDAKGYSGFSLRLKLPHDIRFLTSNKEVHAQLLAVDAGPWMDFTGSFDGPDASASGVAVFCHPSNPGFPQPWVIRSEKSMQNPAFPGRQPVPLPGNGLRFRHRIVIHDHSLDTAALEKLYEAYGQRGK